MEEPCLFPRRYPGGPPQPTIATRRDAPAYVTQLRRHVSAVVAQAERRWSSFGVYLLCAYSQAQGLTRFP